MPRQEFNTTCDLVNGPNQPEPGEVRSTRACRLVPEIFQDISLRPYDLRTHYVTMEGDEPRSPGASVEGNQVIYDYGKADRVAIPSGEDPLYVVLFSEYVDHPIQGPYWRVHVASLDLVDPPVGPPDPPPSSSEYWWKADAIVGLADGDLVSVWPDSADAGDAVSFGPSRPLYLTNELNGLPVLHFRSSTRFMTIPAVATESLTVIAVLRIDTDTNIIGIIAPEDCDGFFFGGYPGGTGHLTASKGCVDEVTADGLTSADGWAVVSFWKDGDAYQFQKQGVEIGSGTYTQTFDDTLAYTMGANLNGFVAEIHVWLEALEPAALDVEIAALMLKWGL